MVDSSNDFEFVVIHICMDKESLCSKVTATPASYFLRIFLFFHSQSLRKVTVFWKPLPLHRCKFFSCDLMQEKSVKSFARMIIVLISLYCTKFLFIAFGIANGKKFDSFELLCMKKVDIEWHCKVQSFSERNILSNISPLSNWKHDSVLY